MTSPRKFTKLEIQESKLQSEFNKKINDSELKNHNLQTNILNEIDDEIILDYVWDNLSDDIWDSVRDQENPYD